jgi:hypothetical protein
LASLRTLDNEALVTSQGSLPFAHVARHWADLIEEHIESAFLAPSEALLEAASLAHAVHMVPMNQLPEIPALGIGAPPTAPPLPHEFPPLLPAASARGAGEVELTFEIVPEVRPPEAR